MIKKMYLHTFTLQWGVQLKGDNKKDTVWNMKQQPFKTLKQERISQFPEVWLHQFLIIC